MKERKHGGCEKQVRKGRCVRSEMLHTFNKLYVQTAKNDNYRWTWCLRAAVTLWNSLHFQTKMQWANHVCKGVSICACVCVCLCARASVSLCRWPAVIYCGPCQKWYVSAPQWDLLQLWFIVQIALPSIMIWYGSVLQRGRDGSTHSTDFWWKVQIVAITLLRTNKHNTPTHTHTHLEMCYCRTHSHHVDFYLFFFNRGKLQAFSWTVTL